MKITVVSEFYPIASSTFNESWLDQSPNLQSMTDRTRDESDSSERMTRSGRKIKVSVRPAGYILRKILTTSSPAVFLPQDIGQRIDSIVAGESTKKYKNFHRRPCLRCGTVEWCSGKSKFCMVCCRKKDSQTKKLTCKEYTQQS
jgi:hypothetical protein